MCDIKEKYDRLYEFENTEYLYHFRFKDTKLPMWMFVRLYVIESLTYNQVYIANKQISEGKKRVKKIEKNIWQKYVIRNPFLSRRKEIVFAFWQYEDLRQHDDGRVYEDFIMPFLQIFQYNSTTLMDGCIQNVYELDCTHPNWKMDDIFTDLLKCREIDIAVEDKRQIKQFIDFLERNCPFPIESDIKKDVYVSLRMFAQYLKSMIKICELYLRITNPKVVIMFCASYPSILRTAMIIACKNKNVMTAELQHGWVGKYNPNTYHCDYIIKTKECNLMLPDYFLTFGEYWNNQIRMASKCITVGYAKSVVDNVFPDNSSILFCAGLHFEMYLELLEEIMPKLDVATKIYFRFHPTSSSQKQKNPFNKYLKYPNFVLADEKDLSDYMKDCRYVIADGSTIVYEALFMGRIVFALESELSIKLGFRDLPDVHVFRDAKDFMKLWSERNKLDSVYHKEFFDLNYKEKYVGFLKKCGINMDCK